MTHVHASKTAVGAATPTALETAPRPGTHHRDQYSTSDSLTQPPKRAVHLLAALFRDEPVELNVLQVAFPAARFTGGGGDVLVARELIAADPELRSAVVAAMARANTTHDIRARTSWTARELMEAELPPPVWVIEGLLPAGAGTLTGRPKLGKSLLASQLAAAVGTGIPFWGRPIVSGPVMYIALEDTPSRFQARMIAQRWNAAAANVRIEFDWPDLGGDGFDRLATALQRDRFTLVIVDTLTRAMTFDQLDVAATTEALGALQHLALDNDAAILWVDHNRKNGGRPSDPIEETLGSTGKTAIVDAIWGLFRERNSLRGQLVVTGRDVPDQELTIELETGTLSWELLGDADAVAQTDVQQLVLDALADLGGSATTTAVAEYVQRDAGQVSRVLRALCDRGLVTRGDRAGRAVPYQLVSGETPADHA